MRAAASRAAGVTPQAVRGGRTAAPVLQPAYLLHRYDWSESSLILDLFTREHGRVAVAAKGAKRPYSQLRAVLHYHCGMATLHTRQLMMDLQAL